jgi:three-Cys-motif partner protein
MGQPRHRPTRPAAVRELPVPVQDAARAAALDHRTAALADRRVVEQGEVNTNRLRVMRAHLPRRNPVLVVLDPYGMEIDWTTLQDIATFRHYKWKAEILILFPIDGINRAMNALGDVDETTLDRFWGDKSRHQLWKEQKMGSCGRPTRRGIAGSSCTPTG